MTQARQDEPLEELSIGELVAMASSSASQLLKAEMELAKKELKDDAIKAALGSVLFALVGLIGGLVVILLSIALAYGFVAMGVWHWLAFIIVAVIYVALGGLLGLIGYLRMRRISGAPRTRKTIKDDLSMLRRPGGGTEQPAVEG